MIWQIEFERLLDGAVLIDRSAVDKESAIRKAYAIIDAGHDVRSVTAPDGTRVGAAVIAEAYLNRFRSGAIIPAQSREAAAAPGPSADDKIRPGQLRRAEPAADVAPAPALRKVRY